MAAIGNPQTPIRAKKVFRSGARWLWPAACVVTLVGYFGSWVPHPVAGLAILGLDLGEYVKFLPPDASGGTVTWREGFYLPLVAVSLACSLLSHRTEYGYAFWIRLPLVILGIVATLNLLPPAWSPTVLATAEFRLQTIAIVISLGMLGLSPILALIPALPVYSVVAVTAASAIWFPVTGFLRVLPRISGLYGHELRPGWALYITVAGLVLLLVSCRLGFRLATRTDKRA